MDEKAYFEAMAKMRRAHVALMTEMNEFVAAAVMGQIEAMNQARQLSHEYLDAYLDGVTVGHVIMRERVK